MNGRRLSSNSIALLEAHVPGLRSFARALLRGDRAGADDLVQDTLERALSRWELRRVEGDLRGWLYTILYNRFLSNQGRQNRRGACDALTEIVENKLPGVDGGQEWALAYRDLLRGFAELPDEQRSVLLLIAVEDFTYKEAARILGAPIGTVMSRLSRGRERLRQYMNGDPPRARPKLANEGHTRSPDSGLAPLGRGCAAVPPVPETASAPAVTD